MRSRIVIYIVRSSIFCATARISTSDHHKPGRKGVKVAVPCVSSILAKIDVRACAKAKKRLLAFPLMDILRELSSGSFAGACTLRASSYSFYSRTAMPPSSHDFDPDNESGNGRTKPAPGLTRGRPTGHLHRRTAGILRHLPLARDAERDFITGWMLLMTCVSTRGSSCVALNGAPSFAENSMPLAV